MKNKYFSNTFGSLSIFLGIISSHMNNESTHNDLKNMNFTCNDMHGISDQNFDALTELNGPMPANYVIDIPNIDENNSGCDKNLSSFSEQDNDSEQHSHDPSLTNVGRPASFQNDPKNHQIMIEHEPKNVQSANQELINEDIHEIYPSNAPTADFSSNGLVLSQHKHSSSKKIDITEKILASNAKFYDQIDDSNNVTIPKELGLQNPRNERSVLKVFKQTVFDCYDEFRSTEITVACQKNDQTLLQEFDNNLRQIKESNPLESKKGDIQTNKQEYLNQLQSQIRIHDPLVIYGMSMSDLNERITPTIKHIVDKDGNRILYLFVRYFIHDGQLVASQKFVNYSEIPSFQTANQLHTEFYNSNLKIKILVFSVFDETPAFKESVEENRKYKWRAFLKTSYVEPMKIENKPTDKMSNKIKISLTDFYRKMSLRNKKINISEDAGSQPSTSQSFIIERETPTNIAPVPRADQKILLSRKSLPSSIETEYILKKRENDHVNEKRTDTKPSLLSHDSVYGAAIRFENQCDNRDNSSILKKSIDHTNDKKTENQKTHNSSHIAPMKPPRTKKVTFKSPEKEDYPKIMHLRSSSLDFTTNMEKSAIRIQRDTDPTTMHQRCEKETTEISHPLSLSHSDTKVQSANEDVRRKTTKIPSVGFCERRYSFLGEATVRINDRVKQSDATNQPIQRSKILNKDVLRTTLSHLPLATGMDGRKVAKVNEDHSFSYSINQSDEQKCSSKNSDDMVKMKSNHISIHSIGANNHKTRMKRQLYSSSKENNSADDYLHNHTMSSSQNKEHKMTSIPKCSNDNDESDTIQEKNIKSLSVNSDIAYQGSNSLDSNSRNNIRDIHQSEKELYLAEIQKQIQRVLMFKITSDSSSSDNLAITSHNLPVGKQLCESQRTQSSDKIEKIEIQRADSTQNECNVSNITNDIQLKKS